MYNVNASMGIVSLLEEVRIRAPAAGDGRRVSVGF